jgi:molecular chaperone DnaJ
MKGDLYFTVKISVPKKLTEEQKDLLRKFAAIGGNNTDEHGKSFFDKVKDAFK